MVVSVVSQEGHGELIVMILACCSAHHFTHRKEANPVSLCLERFCDYVNKLRTHSSVSAGWSLINVKAHLNERVITRKARTKKKYERS